MIKSDKSIFILRDQINQYVVPLEEKSEQYNHPESRGKNQINQYVVSFIRKKI